MKAKLLLVGFLALTIFATNLDTAFGQDSGTYSRFDFYDGTRDTREARIILDNLANQLKTQQTLRGYLIAYAGSRACRNEAASRIREAKRYLKEKHNIDSSQVTFQDGGFRENWVVQIWLGFSQNTPPEKEPTVNRKRVRIIKRCNLEKL